MYCIYCGKELSEGTKYCTGCGKEVRRKRSHNPDDDSPAADSVREPGEEPDITEDDLAGEQSQSEHVSIRKCPQCGEVIESFAAFCPACGHEFRDVESSRAIKLFSEQLALKTTVEERADFIRTFPVPNSREDVMEFLILASSGVDDTDSEILDAWKAKTDQCYKKARLLFSSKNDLQTAEELYLDAMKRLNMQTPVAAAHSFMRLFPNPIVACTVVVLAIYEVYRIITGNFAGMFDILLCGLILWAVIRFTSHISWKSDEKENR